MHRRLELEGGVLDVHGKVLGHTRLQVIKHLTRAMELILEFLKELKDESNR